MEDRGKYPAGLKTGRLVCQHNDVNIHEVLNKNKRTNVFIARHIQEWDDKGKWPEHYEQVALANILRANKIVFHSIPNGGLRDAKTGANLKREGLSPGVPDLYIIDTPVEQTTFTGRPVAIEMKTRNGSLSDVDERQWRWLLHLAKQGWLCILSFGFSAAKQALDLAGYRNTVSPQELFVSSVLNG